MGDPATDDLDFFNTVHSPAADVKVWRDGSVRLVAADGHGQAVSLTLDQATALSSLLYRISEPDFPPYEADDSPFGLLMEDVCVGWGYCGCVKEGRKPLHVCTLLPFSGTITADLFVDLVFLADGQHPDEGKRAYSDAELAALDPKSRSQIRGSIAARAAIRAAFIHRMGADAVDVRRLRFRSDGEAESTETG